jgi:hypothetical protein
MADATPTRQRRKSKRKVKRNPVPSPTKALPVDEYYMVDEGRSVSFRVTPDETIDLAVNAVDAQALPPARSGSVWRAERALPGWIQTSANGYWLPTEFLERVPDPNEQEGPEQQRQRQLAEGAAEGAQEAAATARAQRVTELGQGKGLGSGVSTAPTAVAAADSPSSAKSPRERLVEDSTDAIYAQIRSATRPTRARPERTDADGADNAAAAAAAAAAAPAPAAAEEEEVKAGVASATHEEDGEQQAAGAAAVAAAPAPAAVAQASPVEVTRRRPRRKKDKPLQSATPAPTPTLALVPEEPDRPRPLVEGGAEHTELAGLLRCVQLEK